MLTPEQKQQFKNDGFLLLENIIDPQLLKPLLKELNIWRHKVLMHERTEADKRMLDTTHFCQHVIRSPLMTEVRKLAENIAAATLGNNNFTEVDCQLIGWPPSSPQWKNNWHVDWVNKHLKVKDPDEFPSFQLLMGFPLTPTREPQTGSINPSPGTHEMIAELFSRHDSMKDGLEALSDMMRTQEQPGYPSAVSMSPGDAVIVNSLLPHSVDRNTLPTFSDKLYFRFGHRDEKKRGGLDCVRHPWKGWQGLG
jgi:hypothetical protein